MDVVEVEGVTSGHWDIGGQYCDVSRGKIENLLTLTITGMYPSFGTLRPHDFRFTSFIKFLLHN